MLICQCWQIRLSAYMPMLANKVSHLLYKTYNNFTILDYFVFRALNVDSMDNGSNQKYSRYVRIADKKGENYIIVFPTNRACLVVSPSQ